MIVLSLQFLPAKDSTSVKGKLRFQSAIDAFLKEDSVQPPPMHSIEFIGSSIFRKWEQLKEHMAPLPVYNRAFGGSRTHEVLYYMDKIVLPYKPKIIVYYCGSNDAGGSVPVDSITGNIKAFFEKAERKLPGVKIFFVSVNKAPSRQAKWSAIDSVNAFVKNYCSLVKTRRFIDVNPILFDSTGSARMELYLDDKLHFKDDTYREFTKIIKPILLNEWR